MKKIKKEIEILKNKVRFIEYICNEKISVYKRKKQDIIEQLKEYKFDKQDDSYNYLLDMKIYNLTYEYIDKIEKQLKNYENEEKELKKMSDIKLWKNDMLI